MLKIWYKKRILYLAFQLTGELWSEQRHFAKTYLAQVFFKYMISENVLFFPCLNLLPADTNRENMDSNHNEFIKIGSFIDIFQANMAKEILQSNGISCVVTGDEFRLFDFSPEDNIPVQLIINRNDKDTAQELLILHFNN